MLQSRDNLVLQISCEGVMKLAKVIIGLFVE